MSEDRYEPLQRLATLAPPPPPGLADAVVARARRRRGGLAAALASAATVVAVVVGTLVWSGSSGSTAEQEIADGTPTSPDAPATTDPRPPVSGRLAMVAAGIEYQLRQLVGPQPTRILVSERLCDRPRQATSTGDDGDCRRWASADQARLAALLADVAQVRFVRARATSTARVPLVRVAAVKVRPHGRGSVWIYAVGGGRSCLGNDYLLERSGSVWSVVDEKGFAVIC